MSTLVDSTALSSMLARLHQQTHFDTIMQACQNSQANRHGLLKKWLQQLDALPDVELDNVELKTAVKLGSSQFDRSLKPQFEKQLLEFSPWRKGPFELFEVYIDSEWRSDLKWQRLSAQLDLKDKRVLDVGCGNGYYMLRMLGEGASTVVGVDPLALYVIQFLLVNKYLKSDQLLLLPIGFEDLPLTAAFDVVFSMGVLYHRRSPHDHLLDLKNRLLPQGELVIETLVLDGEGDHVLVPQDRYAGMKNVWSIPTVPTLCDWLHQAGFDNVNVLDITATTLDEQRQTKWMPSYSLNQFLNPSDHNRTIEGHPAPVRVMIKCECR